MPGKTRKEILDAIRSNPGEWHAKIRDDFEQAMHAIIEIAAHYVAAESRNATAGVKRARNRVSASMGSAKP